MVCTATDRTLALLLLVTALGAAPASARAAAAATETFVISGQPERFVRLYDDRLIISEACLARNGDLSCLARAASLKASRGLVSEKDRRGGKNPGSVLCPVLGGEVVFGVDREKNQNSFCRFRDRSLIDNGSLAYYARVNDDIRAARAAKGSTQR